MVKSKSNSRLSRLNRVILTQTDTTVGFVSQDTTQLSIIKSRDTSKQFIQVYSSFKILLESGHRIPKQSKNLLRRSCKTTFIVKNKAFRVTQSLLNSQILRDLKWNYSTSANEGGKKFNLEFCEDKADIIILNKDGLSEKKASSLYKLGNKKRIRIR